MKHDEILKRDYSDKFDELRKAAVIVSHYKYGAVEDNFGKLGDLRFCWEQHGLTAPQIAERIKKELK